MLPPPPTKQHNFPMQKPVHYPRRRPTSPIIKITAIIGAILAVAVIIAGLVVVIGYLAIRPKVPQISVTTALLDAIYFDQTSLLTVQVTIVIKAENENAKAHASFYNTNFALSFHGVKMAYLVAEPFDLSKNSSKEFNYVVQSSPIPLEPEYAEIVSWSLRRTVITFELKGNTRTRWRAGLLGSIKFWLHLNCQLHLPVNRTAIYPRCSSRSK